jgi:hypothetical protein
MNTEQQLADRYDSLNWTVSFHNREHNWESPERLNAIKEQNDILSRLYAIVEESSTAIVDLRDGTNVAEDYVGRTAQFVSVDTGKILRGVVSKNARQKIVIEFEQGNTTVGSILYLAD